MSKTLLSAAMLQLQGKATESLAAIEILLNNSVVISEHLDHTQEIIKHAKLLSENEEALKALQNYFSQTGAPAPESTDEQNK